MNPHTGSRTEHTLSVQQTVESQTLFWIRKCESFNKIQLSQQYS